MSTNDFYTPTDIDALRMENELLAFEVRFLKAYLAQPDRRIAKLKTRLAEVEQAKERLEMQLTRLQAQNASLQAQLVDLKISNPLSRVFRRKG